MAKVTNELVTQFSFQGSINPLTQYNQAFTNSISIMAKGIGIVTALNAAMVGFAASQLQNIDAMGQLSKETGVSVNWLKEMGYVAEVNGGSVEGLRSSIIGLSEKIGESSINGSEDFNRLGISVRDANGQVKSTTQVLDELRERFKGLDKSQQISFAQKLGIDKSMLQTLNLTNKEIEATRKKIADLSLVNAENTDLTMEFNDSLTTTKTIFQTLGENLSLSMIPRMTTLIDSFNEFLFTNGKVINEGLKSTIFWFNAITDTFINVGKAVYEGIDYFIGMDNALRIAGAGAIYFGRALLLNPLSVAIGLVGGLVAIIDDLYVAFNGGKSVIKDFFMGFDIDIVKNLGLAFEGVKLTVNTLLGLLLRVSEAITSVVLIGAKAGNFLGADFDIQSIENFKKMQEQTRLGLSGGNQTNNQNITINQTITGQDAERIGELSTSNIGEVVKGANAQLTKGGR